MLFVFLGNKDACLHRDVNCSLFVTSSSVSHWGEWLSPRLSIISVGPLPGVSACSSLQYHPTTTTLPVFRKVCCLPSSPATQSWSICTHPFRRRGRKTWVFFAVSSPPPCSVFVLFLEWSCYWFRLSSRHSVFIIPGNNEETYYYYYYRNRAWGTQTHTHK